MRVIVSVAAAAALFSGCAQAFAPVPTSTGTPSSFLLLLCSCSAAVFSPTNHTERVYCEVSGSATVGAACNGPRLRGAAHG